MVAGVFETFLDGRGIGPKEPVRTSFMRDDTWYVQDAGPNYVNVARITVFDEAGLAWLKAIEVKEE